MYGYNDLHNACCNNDMSEVKKLVENVKIDVNVKTLYGKTALAKLIT